MNSSKLFSAPLHTLSCPEIQNKSRYMHNSAPIHPSTASLGACIRTHADSHWYTTLACPVTPDIPLQATRQRYNRKNPISTRGRVVSCSTRGCITWARWNRAPTVRSFGRATLRSFGRAPARRAGRPKSRSFGRRDSDDRDNQCHGQQGKR